MEKWKIGTIVLCLAIPVVYGLYSDKQDSAPPAPTAPTPGPAATPPPYLGKALPAWNLPLQSQWTNSPKPIKLSDLKGSYSLIEIFRINCSHCQEMAPMMVSIDKRYVPRGLKVVAIQSPGQFKDMENTENDFGAVKQWLKEKQIPYPVAFDGGSKYFQGTLKGTFYPSVIILDPTGKVIFFQTGDDAEKGLKLTTTLEKMLPGPGNLAARVKNLSAWLRNFTNYNRTGPELDADVAQRLK